MPKVGDMSHSTPASEDPCHINVDSNTHYDAFEDAYVPGEFKNQNMSINAVSLE